ncbi:MAG: BON domain-containing protein [Betaproteobacteria bacterium]|nr:MAG: BON domain-containing protein [Betaproteobacteria bacterium]
MSRSLSILAAAAAGAAATYLLDAEEGRRRRAILRDKVRSRLSHLDATAAVVGVDLRNRTQGVIAGLRGEFTDEDVPDGVLAERVRSKLGRLLAHPGSVDVSVMEGRVTLRGPVLKRELKRALHGVAAVRGVKGLENLLEPHEQAGDVPGLQGGTRRGDLPDILQGNWSPATRLVMGAGGAAALAYGLARRSPAAVLLGLGGAALLARAGTNMDMKRLVGWRGHRSVELQRTIHIDAPVEALYRFWSDFANFPKFMRNVRSVHRNADDTWHWEVAGPFATTVGWDARITRAEPPNLISWATVPGWSVQHSGIVRLEPEGAGTRIDIRMSYNPVAGALGHFVAWLAGRDPQSQMDEDLMRLKTFLEGGKPARDAAQPLRTAL